MLAQEPPSSTPPPPGKTHSQKPKQDIIHLADGFTYIINGHGRPVHQARNTVQCPSENSSDDIIEELVHETHYKIYRVKVQVHQTDTTIQQMSQIFNEDILEELMNGFKYSTTLDKGKVLQSTDTSTCCTEGAAEFSFKLREACRIRALQGGALKKVAEFLTPAVQVGNISCLCNLRTMHYSFSEDPVLLLTRSMASTMGTWPDQVQEFGKPLHLSLCHLKQTLVQVNLPTSQQAYQGQLLCVDLQYPEPQDATPEVPPTELGCTGQLQEGSAQGLVPFSPRGLIQTRLGMQHYQKPGRSHLCKEHILRELLKMPEAHDTKQCCSERSTSDIVHQVAIKSYCNYYQDRVQVHKANTIVKFWSKNFKEDLLKEFLNGLLYLTWLDKGYVFETTDTSTCYPEALKGQMVKNVENIADLNFLVGNISHLTMFNSAHLAFTRAKLFLDDLLPGSCALSMTLETIKVFWTPVGISAYNDNGHSPRDQIKRAMASTVGPWPDPVQGLGKPLHLSLVHLKQALLHVKFPTSQQLCKTQYLWVNLEYPEPQDATPEDLLPEFKSNAHPQEVHANWLAPGPARCLTRAWPGLMQCLNLGWRLLLCFSILALLGILSFILNI